MAFQLIIALLLAVGYSSAGVPSRIIGGSPTYINYFPELAQVEYLNANSGTWSQSCAANILTSRYLLSAAHCFSGSLYSPYFTRIRAGATYRGVGGQTSPIMKEIFHPTYGQNGEDGDIALVEILTPFVYTPEIQQATIMAPGVEVPDYSSVEHAGWGFTDVNGERSEQLHFVSLFTANNQQCREQYAAVDRVVTDNMICVGIPDVGGKAACQGDDGGPLMYDSKLLVGIVSWGYGCADPAFPGISTKVSSYTNWIVENVV